VASARRGGGANVEAWVRSAWRLGMLGWDGLLDLVYPPHCLVCQEPARPILCDACAQRFVVPIPPPVCPVCGRPQEPDPATGNPPDPCRHCRENAPSEGGWGFDSARAVAIYEGPLRHAIHCLKYGHVALLGEPLGAFFANQLVAEGLLRRDAVDTVDVVVPVPIHKERLRKRGFNQAALLAGPVAEQLGVPFLPDAAVRARRTPPQVGLSPDARRTNLVGAFVVPDAAPVSGQRVLLVDDVFTTGATVSACARALKKAGAVRVDVATLAGGG